MEAFAGILIIVYIAAAILWFALPFAVFGIKGKMDRQARLTEELIACINRK